MGAAFEQVKAEDLKMGMVIRVEDGMGQPLEIKVYRIRRISHLEGMLQTEAGDERVPLGQKFTVVYR